MTEPQTITAQLPPIYSFPPLYTCQPNALIRQQQLDTWCELILEFAKTNKAWCMSQEGTIVTNSEQASSIPSIFVNEQIQRSAAAPFIEEIWSKMLQSEKAIRSSKSTYIILWKSLDSWSSLILQWCESSGKLNQVITLYELTEGDETLDWEFHGMDIELCEKCLLKLCDRGRATMLKDQGKVMGVKIV
ncbi:LAFE_0G16688g1_1 [Lachancea fermentati]|uniref:LAFE_0G16688g1_1 n=1 Tax=Lachancea fermentati TaxID=4955 RepID=A0A1G4MIR4_LACFM|nr:LAFE_0G16688g1_1 [Lachancea fermentati]